MSFKKLMPLFMLFVIGNSLASNTTAVTTQPIGQLTIFPKIEAPATAISLNDSIISAEINGIVEQLPFKVGETIKKGDILAHIACQEYELTAQQYNSLIEASKAKIKFTEWKLNRIKSLASDHNVSQEQLKELQSNLTSLSATLSSQEAQLNQAKLQIQRCDIRAPFEGVVVERLVDIGEMVTPGRQVMQLVDKSDLEVSAQLQADEIQKLQLAKTPVFVTKTAQYPVRLRSAVDVYNKPYRTQEVRCVFTQDKPLPGSVGRLVWHDSQPHLPAHLLSQNKGQFGIFVANNQKAEFLTIENAIEGRPIPLPLQLDSDIVIDGRYQLSDGSDISIKKPEKL